MRNFKILIDSAVTICKQCLQAASAFGRLRSPGPLPGQAPGNPLGTSLLYSTPNENSGAASDQAIIHKTLLKLVLGVNVVH